MAFRLRQWLVPTLKLHRRHKCPNNETRETPPSRISLWFLVLLRSKWPLFVVFTCGVVWRVLLLCVWDCVTIIAGVRKKEICYGCWATNRTMRQLNKGASLSGKNKSTTLETLFACDIVVRTNFIFVFHLQLHTISSFSFFLCVGRCKLWGFLSTVICRQRNLI